MVSLLEPWKVTSLGHWMVSLWVKQMVAHLEPWKVTSLGHWMVSLWVKQMVSLLEPWKATSLGHWVVSLWVKQMVSQGTPLGMHGGKKYNFLCQNIITITNSARGISYNN